MKDHYKSYYGKIAAFVLLLIFASISWYGVLPFVVNTFEKNQVRKELTERIALVSNWEERFSLLTDQNEKLTEAILAMESESIAPHESYLITKKVYDSAEDFGINIQKMEPGNIVASNKGREQDIEISLLGRYHEIARFIQALERSEYNITIQGFDLQNRNQSSLIEASVEVLVNYIVES